MRENNILKMEMDDMKITLAMNKELLFNYISNDKSDKDELYAKIREENKCLSDKINQMFADRSLLEKKVILNNLAL
jgi:beta-N-acetylglucosaminidase